MSQKRFWWSVAAVWIAMMVTDWVFHGWWLRDMYMATASLWRPMEEMQKMMWTMWLGRALYSFAFVWIYSKGITNTNPWWQAFRYAWAILAVSCFPEILGSWATAPYPTALVMNWLWISAVQAMICAVIMTWTFKPLEWWNQQKTHA